MNGHATTVTAFAPVPRPVPIGRFRRRCWHIVGDGAHPVARELRARSAPPCAGPGEHRPGTAVLLGTDFGWEDNARLLDGIAAARRDGGRLALVHLGAGGASLLRVAAVEDPRLEVVSVELPAGAPPRALRVAVSLVSAEPAAGAELRVDASGRVTRTAWQPVVLPAAGEGGDRTPSSVLVTGGLGGLGLRAAAVALRTRNLHPVLLDNTRQDALGADQVTYLRRLRSSGATVLDVDITDPRRTAHALTTVDAPPIRVVLHCAGVLHGGPLSDVTSGTLVTTQMAKVDGLRNVLAGLDLDRLDNLVTFGSITAEEPHRSLGCYALANELLRRATLRAAPDLPRCATVAAQWSLWSGAGMAARMAAPAQARRMGMTPVSLRAGMITLLRLLAWRRGPEAATSLLLHGHRCGSVPFRIS